MSSKLARVTIDFETYYDDKYSLKKLTPEEYIRDERFQILGCAVKPAGRRARYITGKTEDEILERLRSFKWDRIFAVGHNMSGFDSLVLTERVGVRPRYWGCTLSMAAQVLGSVPHPKTGKRSLSLDALAGFFGLPLKTGGLAKIKGKRLEDLAPEDQQIMTEYAEWDAELCDTVYQRLIKYIPPQDMRLMHWFIRMFAEPRIVLDRHGYTTWLKQIEDVRQRLLDSVGVPITDLRSNPKFAELLRAHGVEPPTKISKTTGKETYAFAKTDRGMTALLEHEDPVVRALAEARLKTKSSIEQTRVTRLIDISKRGKLPVTIKWGMTHTMRASGGGRINMQNLSRTKGVNEKTPEGTLLVTDKGLRTLSRVDGDTVHTREGQQFSLNDCHVYGLRDGLKAHRGYKWVVCDSSNIELRVAHCLAGQMDTVEKIRKGEDMYCDFASTLYGRKITKKDKKERQHGKVGMLQLQYQSGAGAFREAARVMGGVHLTEEEAATTVQMYRDRFPALPQFWRRCARAIECMASGERYQLDQWGLISTDRNRLILPRGRFIEYRNLRKEPDEQFGYQWVYDDRNTGEPKRCYGGSITENICQALAGIIVLDQCMELETRWGRYDSPETGAVLTVHDEVGMIVRESDAQACLEDAIRIMSTPPSWWPQLPLAAEGDIADRYGSAK